MPFRIKLEKRLEPSQKIAYLVPVASLILALLFGALVLLSDVRELTLEYWDAPKEEWLDKWDAQGSDPNQASKLPQRVRLKITAVMGDGEQQTFMTQTRIWLPAPIKL